MSTVNRAGSYVHNSIASLFSSDFIDAKLTLNLMVSGHDTSFLDCYKSNDRIMIHPLDKVEEDKWLKRPPQVRCGFNAIRAMHLGNPKESVVVLEDDLLFCKSFVKRVLQAAEEAFHVQNKFMIALYSVFPAPLSDFSIIKVNPDNFCNTQGMYYPGTIKMQLADFLTQKMVKEGSNEPNDWLIGRHFGRSIDGVFFTHQALVQHVGNITAINNIHWHQSTTFADW